MHVINHLSLVTTPHRFPSVSGIVLALGMPSHARIWRYGMVTHLRNLLIQIASDHLRFHSPFPLPLSFLFPYLFPYQTLIFVLHIPPIFILYSLPSIPPSPITELILSLYLHPSTLSS